MTGSPRRRSIESAGVGLGTFLLFGVVTGLIPNPIYVRMVERTPADYLFLLATAAFAAAFFYRRNRPSASGLDPEGEGRALG